jgi:integrase
MDRSHRRCEALARSAFISRREGRYIFAIRTPACLKSIYRSGSIRLALGTANYQMASTRAALIASWFLRIRTMDADPRKAMVELWPRLQALAREPVRNETDYIERRAFQGIAFDVQFLVRHSGAKPDEIVAGWDEHFVMLIRENSRAGHIIEKNNSLAGRVERRREELFAQGAEVVVSPMGANTSPTVISSAVVAAAVSAAMPPEGNRSRLSEVLKKFLDWREGEDGDRRAANDVAPIIQFAIDLWKDPCIGDIGPDQLVLLKKAMPEIPTPSGFLVDVRSLYQRWSIAKTNDYVVETDGKKIKLVRVSASTLRKRYRSGLNAFWAFLIKNLYVLGPAPDFSSSSKQNPPAVERDAFEPEELLKFLGAPLFTGCAGISRVWNVGEYFCQTYFYWAVLIQLLCGLRPGEISQLRCADIATLYGEWHFRFAKRSLAESDDDDSVDDADTDPGGNDAKTKNAFRWVPVHPLLDQLGILARRDAIASDYIRRKYLEAGGQDRLTKQRCEAIAEEALQQWLFPEWKVYILPSGQVRWSQAVSKAWQYVKVKLKMQRKGLALYSARHTFKGFIDDLTNLSERSRRIVMGHSTAINTAGGYGPKTITEEQAEVILGLSNSTIKQMAELLLEAHDKAQRGQLKIIDAWRNDERSNDEKLQAALAKRAEEYR